MVAGLYWLTAPNPRAEYQQALKLLADDPARAERMAEMAISNSGGNFPEAQLLQCRALAAMGQWHMSLGGFSLIKDTSSCDPAFLLDLGERAFAAGEWKLAELSLQATARQTGPAQVRAYELLVQLHMQFQHHPEALVLCREWQRADPDAALPWAIAGDLESAAVELGPAIADYREALKRTSTADLKEKTCTALARLLVLAGDTVAARQEFDQLLKEKPLPTSAQLSYAQLLRFEGRLDEALQEIDNYISRAGKNAESQKQRGIIHLDAGKLDLALADLKESVQKNPSDIAAQHKLAQVYTRLGNTAAAKQHLELGRRLSDAANRIPELEKQLQARPGDADLHRELRDAKSVLGIK
jgi:tetratricopeptide (TPR) repeat protein